MSARLPVIVEAGFSAIASERGAWSEVSTTRERGLARERLPAGCASRLLRGRGCDHPDREERAV